MDIGSRGRRRLFLPLVALSLVACSATQTGRPRHSIPGSTPSVSAMTSCSAPASLGRNASIASARLGAIDFLSPEVGVALSAPEIPCSVPVGHGKGVNIFQHVQPVRLAVSTDGGRQWVTQGRPVSANTSTTKSVVEQLVATSTKTAWALVRGTLMVTVNGGTTWASQPLPTPVIDVEKSGSWLWALACPSSAGGARCSPVLERKPVTGGAWDKLPIPELQPSVPRDLLVVSTEVAVLLLSPYGDAPGMLAVTTDAGTNWTLEAPPSGPENLCGSDAAIAASGPSNWWLLCLGGAAAGSSTKALMHSGDGGQTWSAVAALTSFVAPIQPGSITSGEPAALAAGSSSQLWLAGFNELTESNDGGATWTRVPGVDEQGAFSSFDVLSSRMVWLLAPGTGLWATTDGATWSALGAIEGL